MVARVGGMAESTPPKAQATDTAVVLECGVFGDPPANCHRWSSVRVWGCSVMVYSSQLEALYIPQATNNIGKHTLNPMNIPWVYHESCSMNAVPMYRVVTLLVSPVNQKYVCAKATARP